MPELRPCQAAESGTKQGQIERRIELGAAEVFFATMSEATDNRRHCV